MRKIFYGLVLAITMIGCKATQQTAEDSTVMTNIDLVNVQDDKVIVSLDPGKFTTTTTTFYIPKTVPGTYSTDNYGKFMENLQAYDYDGNQMNVTRLNHNSWQIDQAGNLDKVTYWVNDSFDVEGEEGVFSPAGTNIEKDENFMLNLHGFVGYFEGLSENAYQLSIKHPTNLTAGTSLQKFSTPESQSNTGLDVFRAKRYFEITDNPIMYADSDMVTFNLDGMEVELQVYSPNNAYTAEDLKPNMQKVLQAQKDFLGDVNSTDKYVILLYLADMQELDARGFGALEHHTSTSVVLPETMPLETLNETMTDVVSHEFFHIITPLSVHSKEVHYFDYNNPKMSQHLWMYEGVTEYFANLFQVKQDLIDNQAFYERMSEKIATAQSFDDTMPFTELSKNVLKDKYKDSYYNVYMKGALIGMTLDIRLRELSNGEMGILDLMKKLSNKYGQNKPFEDNELIPTIVEMTYPEIQTYFDKYVIGSTPIPYDEFFAKVGVEKAETTINTSYFLKGQVPYIDGKPETNELYFREGIAYNSFLNDLGVEPNDIIKTINGKKYGIDNVYGLIVSSQGWTKDDTITMVVERDGEEIELSAKAKKPTAIKTSLKEMDLPATDKRVQLRKAWLN
ncbi:M61 family metallopeptidase [Haloflavibacter putidus]|uniref:Peptidase M61 n=1 Tax=Haloflavibacter putidus TaxID=2576776 RepID=A0A507ZX48_9FLAO|nr:peptidase M61 [Haloflavibacter putidus]TQD39345.1 peptidase M61 [Haloflavibacter putidus]